MATLRSEDLSPRAIRELARELKALDEGPPQGIRVLLNEDNIANIQAEIEGPVGTPYEGGLFKMRLVLGSEFPQAPPKGYFLTRIFHPNVAKNGEICVNVLKKDWKPSLGLRHVLLVIRCLLIEPFPESALNEEAGKMLMEDYDAYAKHARLMTSIHAVKSRAKLALGVDAVDAADAAKGPLTAGKGAGALAPSHVPLTHNITNTDVPPSDSASQQASLASVQSISPSAKKPKAETGQKGAGAEKRKLASKRSLKRL